MPRFCVNRMPRDSGEHEIHDTLANCPDLPDSEDRIPLGNHASCHGAVIEARKIYGDVDGCAYCAPDCHSR